LKIGGWALVKNADSTPSFRINDLIHEFAAACEPTETEERLLHFSDARTGAHYCECHIKGSKLVSLGTTDVPLDPDEPEYRANREIVEDDLAFQRMKDDAVHQRSFSNIVAQWTVEQDPDHPLKIIGGQHRFEAIRGALAQGVDVHHGIKVYFALDMQQRLDVQLISNTNIDISGDLIDRLQETSKGPELRNWCQAVGLLDGKQDFADSFQRGGPISVRFARTFITNYFEGMTVDPQKFALTETTPVLCPSGRQDEKWEQLKATKPNLWNDAGLINAAREYAALVTAQREAFKDSKKIVKPDFPVKALNMAIMSAWAYVSGMLRKNQTRLRRHFDLRQAKGRDPLNADALAKGHHKSDSDNYRGLGYRTDAKERGRFVELFYLQGEHGGGVTPSAIDIAIQEYHIKQARVEVEKTKEKAKSRKKQ
jgi:hypothetical protein